MSAYVLNQEFDNVRWSSGMPIAVMVNSEIVQIRARGTCALTVVDTAVLTAQIPDPADLPATLRPVFASAAIDSIGELSASASDLAQVTSITDQTHRLLLARLEPALIAFGLKIQSLHIEAIESV